MYRNQTFSKQSILWIKDLKTTFQKFWQNCIFTSIKKFDLSTTITLQNSRIYFTTRGKNWIILETADVQTAESSGFKTAIYFYVQGVRAKSKHWEI